MGRDWLYWVIGGAAANGGLSRRRRKLSKLKVAEEDSFSSGCMCSVFQLFDMHPFQLPLNHHHNLQDQGLILPIKGIEAPRNSLELEEKRADSLMPLPVKEDENLNFPVGMQIKTRITTKTEDVASECSTSSPGTKTPSLVARLMGLDLLPENNSPSSSSSSSKPKAHLKNLQNRSRRTFSDDDMNIGVRSLPETPRTSSSRRSDVEYHRLSLQNDEFGKRGSFKDQHRHEENRSPGNYAKQIVKQVKENVSRRFGMDITNREEQQVFRRDQNLVLLKPTKKTSRTDERSPKSRFSENKNAQGNFKDSKKRNESSKCSKKCPNEGFRKKTEETFVRSGMKNKAKKCKKPPLMSEAVNISGPNLMPVKKDPSPPATKLPQKQSQVSDALSSKRNTQLSRNPSHSYTLQTHKIFTLSPDNTNDSATTSSTAAADHRNYVQRILKRTGIIDRFTPLTLGKWNTPSNPLDPSIFYYLELFHGGRGASSAAVLSRRSNRKLIFQLVDELLAGILKTHFDFKFWAKRGSINDCFDLVDELCGKIDGFPAANCQFLEDIDFLVEKDLGKDGLNEFVEEEGEGLVREIEGEIWEELVRETVAAVGVRTTEVRGRRLLDVTWYT